MQCSDHRGAGRESVVHDDDDASARIDGRTMRCIQRSTPTDRRELRLRLPLDIGARGTCLLRVVRDVAPARLVDGAHRELRIPGSVELPHQHDVELSVEPLRDDRAHGNRAPRDRGDQRIAAAPRGQRLRQ
jgi:hypothetical protein